MAKTFNKDTWLKEKTEKLDAAKAALEQGLKHITTSEQWQQLLKSMAHAGALSVLRYSFTNNFLIQLGRPGTAYAATYKRWSELGRQVRTGEKGTSILRPIFKARKDELGADDESRRALVGFGLVTVFALEQTDGEPFTTPKLPDVTAEEAFDESIEKLRDVALAIDGAPVSGVTLRPREAGDHPSACGWYVPSDKSIVVIADERPRAHQFKTLCHEVAHALLHPAGEHHARHEAEVEAESTAFVVCHALGLDTGTYSFPYVQTWAHGDNAIELLTRSGERITKASRTILDALMPVAPEAAAADAA